MQAKIISGKSLAESIFQDVERFFYYSKKFRIRRAYDSNMRGHAACAGSGKTMTVRLSSDFCGHNIKNLENLFLSSFVICHEIAHYINFHNTHTDRDNSDSVAIEARADNLGAMVFMVVITLGSETRNLISYFTDHKNGNYLIPYIGKALGTLYSTIFLPNASNKYPEPIHRVRVMVCGFLSFFRRYFGDLPEIFTINFILEILRGRG